MRKGIFPSRNSRFEKIHVSLSVPSVGERVVWCMGRQPRPSIEHGCFIPLRYKEIIGDAHRQQSHEDTCKEGRTM